MALGLTLALPARKKRIQLATDMTQSRSTPLRSLARYGIARSAQFLLRPHIWFICPLAQGEFAVWRHALNRRSGSFEYARQRCGGMLPGQRNHRWVYQTADEYVMSQRLLFGKCACTGEARLLACSCDGVPTRAGGRGSRRARCSGPAVMRVTAAALLRALAASSWPGRSRRCGSGRVLGRVAARVSRCRDKPGQLVPGRAGGHGGRQPVA